MQQIPDDCDTRLANLIYLMMGIFRAKEVQLPLVGHWIANGLKDTLRKI